MTWSLTGGQSGDAPEGRFLIGQLGAVPEGYTVALLMDSAYEDNATYDLACSLGFTPVVPPNPRRLEPWEYDKELYRQRNRVERLFRRLKAWRRIFTRYDKLDVMFAAFITCALIAEGLR